MSNHSHGFNPEAQRRRVIIEQERLEAQRQRQGFEKFETVSDIDNQLVALGTKYLKAQKGAKK